MNKRLRKTILDGTAAKDLHFIETIQPLWSGYGSIDRYGLSASEMATVVVKHVRLPEQSQHPRGWNTNHSHQRKLHSYKVETQWYRSWAVRCDGDCRVPDCLALVQQDDEFLMVLEDLDNSGYPVRITQPRLSEIKVCLKWLANFHANFMGCQAEGLWKTGTYWHLDTRPDELANIVGDERLQQMAPLVDQLLKNAPFQTVVHGDAKLANFCFSSNTVNNRPEILPSVAMVDFQYVGKGCGMKDVAYLIGSCLDESDCEKMETILLDSYFSDLKLALATRQPQIDSGAVETAWRPLYAIAWTDFYRFLKGWSPEHWKIHRYSEKLAHEVMSTLIY